MVEGSGMMSGPRVPDRAAGVLVVPGRPGIGARVAGRTGDGGEGGRRGGEASLGGCGRS